jgi:serine/threonine protein kinase
MGEVYRAWDTVLKRSVALKILLPEFSRDEQRIRRFLQEARSAAALNHPNILAIHYLGAQDDLHYIVSELLEGETLRERLRSGPLSATRAVELGLQIAGGLAAAHQRG